MPTRGDSASDRTGPTATPVASRSVPERGEADQPVFRLDATHLDALVQALRAEGFAVIGPTVRDGAIVLAELESASELPRGVSDEQGPGRYQLKRPGHQEFFAFGTGAHAYKRELLPPRRRLWTAVQLQHGGMQLHVEPTPRVRRAFFGARACDVAALGIQNRVLIHGHFRDDDYATRRADVAIVAVNCTHPANTCFCASMGTGPRVRSAFDLALTEVVRDDEHWVLVEVGSPLGARLVEQLPTHEATRANAVAAHNLVEAAHAHMGRHLDTDGLRELLERAHDSPHWDSIAERCLACTNCTMACPTCFCSALEDAPALDGVHAERWKRWDSCFTSDFSYIHGGVVRESVASRYRQWLTHKLGTWWDQFGSSGCVGCGRCITWCPVGIDLTEEVARLRDGDTAGVAGNGMHSEVTP